jgi:hypothetical protein
MTTMNEEVYVFESCAPESGGSLRSFWLTSTKLPEEIIVFGSREPENKSMKHIMDEGEIGFESWAQESDPCGIFVSPCFWLKTTATELTGYEGFSNPTVMAATRLGTRCTSGQSRDDADCVNKSVVSSNMRSLNCPAYSLISSVQVPLLTLKRPIFFMTCIWQPVLSGVTGAA